MSESRKFYKFEENKFIWNCPGCECLHHIQTDKNETPCWDFDGNLERPTISPSVRVRAGENGDDYVCHFFIRNGQIQFLDDSTHTLKGQTVEIPLWEECDHEFEWIGGGNSPDGIVEPEHICKHCGSVDLHITR